MAPETEEPVVVYAGSFAIAGLLQNRLEDAGIKADLWDAAASSIVGLTLQTRVAVAMNDVERAGPIVKEFIQQSSDEGSQQQG